MIAMPRAHRSSGSGNFSPRDDSRSARPAGGTHAPRVLARRDSRVSLTSRTVGKRKASLRLAARRSLRSARSAQQREITRGRFGADCRTSPSLRSSLRWSHLAAQGAHRRRRLRNQRSITTVTPVVCGAFSCEPRTRYARWHVSYRPRKNAELNRKASPRDVWLLCDSPDTRRGVSSHVSVFPFFLLLSCLLYPFVKLALRFENFALIGCRILGELHDSATSGRESSSTIE